MGVKTKVGDPAVLWVWIDDKRPLKFDNVKVATTAMKAKYKSMKWPSTTKFNIYGYDSSSRSSAQPRRHRMT